METFDVLESQLWIGATALSPEEMAEAMDKTLRELGYAFDRIGEDIEYPPKKEMKVFKIKGPPLTIAFHWNVPVCSTYPLCPTLEECLWAYKPLGTVRITPVKGKTRAAPQKKKNLFWGGERKKESRELN